MSEESVLTFLKTQPLQLFIANEGEICEQLKLTVDLCPL